MIKELTVIFYTSHTHRDDFTDTYSVDYKNCTIQIKSNNMVIEIYRDTDDINHPKTIEGYVFNLNEIKSYKAKY